MNKPYKCHQCGETFDAFPEMGGPMMGRMQTPKKVKVKCPGCYAAGYTGCPGSLNPPGKGDMVYTLDISGETPVLVE
jgi:hypothetical protein